LDSFLSVVRSDCVGRNLDWRDCQGRAKVGRPVTNYKESTEIPPNSKYVLWCPFCDEWSCRDSMIARKRLGMHVSNKHPEEVRFQKDTQPPEIVDIEGV